MRRKTKNDIFNYSCSIILLVISIVFIINLPTVMKLMELLGF